MRADLHDTTDQARQNMAVLSSQPVQYRDGAIKFCGFVFSVDSRALIPRFETEFLVTEALDWCKTHKSQEPWSILDLGTGSGVIAICIALNLPDAHIIASDISPDALALAVKNATWHNVQSRIQFLRGSLLEPIAEPPDIIVANLPYIPTAHLSMLDPTVRDWEPHIALDGGGDGFLLYRQLFAEMRRKSLPGRPKLAILEIDDAQEKIAAQEIQKHFPKASCKILPDSSGLIRYVKIEF